MCDVHIGNFIVDKVIRSVLLFGVLTDTVFFTYLFSFICSFIHLFCRSIPSQ